MRNEAPNGAPVGIALAVVVGLLMWVGIVMVTRWLLDAGPATLARLGALLVLVAGSALIFFALAHIEQQDAARARRELVHRLQAPRPRGDYENARAADAIRREVGMRIARWRIGTADGYAKGEPKR